MSAAQSQQPPFPVAPPSSSAGDHEMRDSPAAPGVARPFLQPPSQQHTPYLGLRDRLSQVWINRWTVLLLLVLVRTLLAIASLDDSLGSARTKALSACTSVEHVGSSLASMPHYLADGVNQLTVHGVDKAVNGLISMLELTVTGVEEIIVFYINLLVSTYLCLITFAVGGSLHVAIEVAEAVGDFLNATVKDVGHDLQNVANGFQTTVNKVLGGINDVGDFFTGKDTKAPTLDISKQIASLNNLKLPSDYDQGLSKLNASIPTFDQVQNFTNTAIRFPFEEVKKLLNKSLPHYSMNRSLFPVPEKDELTFCSDNNGINDFFDKLINIEHFARKIFIIVLLLAAVLACIPMAYREIRRWRMMETRTKLVKTDAVDNIDAAYLITRPYTSSAGLALASKCTSPRRKAMVRWSVAYATTVPALFVLSLALAGLLGCLCQYILLRAVEKEVPDLTNEVGAFADKVVNSLNNASAQWANGTNKIILDTNNVINHDVLGWVNTTTGAVNHTLNVFVDSMTSTLNTTFGGTPLYTPIMEVLNCLVLMKIRGIEKGLTWVSDHAYVDFPQLPANTFSIGALQKMEAGGNNSILATGPAQPSHAASDAISAIVISMVKHLEGAIRQEAIISTCILIVWLIIVLIGILRSAVMLFGRTEPSFKGPTDLQEKSTPFQEKDAHYHDADVGGFHPPQTGMAMATVPTYEQATKDTTASRGNVYHGQAYTLTPQPIPTFKIDSPRQPVVDPPYPTDEKLGRVGVQNVGSARHDPKVARASSHGNFSTTSPTDPYYPKIRFPTSRSKDPFADPR